MLIDQGWHERQVADLRTKLSLRCTLKDIKYPFYLVNWNDVKYWVKWQTHDKCMDNDALVRFTDIKPAADKTLIVMYVSHEWARSEVRRR